MNETKEYLLNFILEYNKIVSGHMNNFSIMKKEMFLLYAEILAENERVYDYVDSVYNQSTAYYLKQSRSSTFYNNIYISRINYRNSVYARKILGILTGDGSEEFLHMCLKKGWRKLYKFITNQRRVCMSDVMAEFTDFSNPYDKSFFVALLIGYFEKKEFAECASPTWKRNAPEMLHYCRCLQEKTARKVEQINSEKDNYGFWRIDSFHRLYELFNSEKNDCEYEVNQILSQINPTKKQKAKEYYKRLLTCECIVDIGIKDIQQISREVRFNNIDYLSSLSLACINSSLRKCSEFSACFNLFKMFSEILDAMDIDASSFENVKYERGHHALIAHRLSVLYENCTPYEYLFAYLIFSVGTIYNQQKSDAYSSSLLQPLDKLESLLLELHNEKDSTQKYKEENQRLLSELNQTQNLLNNSRIIMSDNLRLTQRVDYLTKEIDQYKNQIKNLSDALQTLEELLRNEDADDGSTEPINETSFDMYRIYVIGGYPAWRNKLQSKFPVLEIVSQEDSSRLLNNIEEYDLIVFNIVGSSHSDFYKISSKMASYNKLLMINTTNIERTVSLISKRLKSIASNNAFYSGTNE